MKTALMQIFTQYHGVKHDVS